MRLPSKGGGTPNGLAEDGGERGSSSNGVFGGRGGGGGPGVAELLARPLEGGSGFARMPASASGGGTLNVRRGGDGSRGGLGEGLGGRWTADAFPAADFLGGGGAGGGPRFDVPPDEPVF